MKLLIDMNLSPRWVAVLNDGGLQAVHWSDLGKPDAPDSQIMAYARANDYVVLTQDLDFSAILAATQGEKPSVVQIRASILSPAAIGEKMIAVLSQMALELEKGALVTVEPERTRLRLLPLRGYGRD